jgi:hypothetical protein
MNVPTSLPANPVSKVLVPQPMARPKVVKTYRDGQVAPWVGAFLRHRRHRLEAGEREDGEDDAQEEAAGAELRVQLERRGVDATRPWADDAAQSEGQEDGDLDTAQNEHRPARDLNAAIDEEGDEDDSGCHHHRPGQVDMQPLRQLVLPDESQDREVDGDRGRVVEKVEPRGQKAEARVQCAADVSEVATGRR